MSDAIAAAALDRMDRAVVRIAECLTDPAMTDDNVWGWQAVLDASWGDLDTTGVRGDQPDVTPTTTAAVWPLFCRGPRWFRIKGWGVRYVDHRRHPMLFGERNGYQRALHIGPHCFRWITPWPSRKEAVLR